VTPELLQLLQEQLVSGQQDIILAMRIKKTSNYLNYGPRVLGSVYMGLQEIACIITSYGASTPSRYEEID
jgi:hypothetical protein